METIIFCLTLIILAALYFDSIGDSKKLSELKKENKDLRAALNKTKPLPNCGSNVKRPPPLPPSNPRA
jgi:hypothetical protein